MWVVIFQEVDTFDLRFPLTFFFLSKHLLEPVFHGTGSFKKRFSDRGGTLAFYRPKRDGELPSPG